MLFVCVLRPIKYKTKGVFIAIEKAVMFLLAVTPLSNSPLICPDALSISYAC